MTKRVLPIEVENGSLLVAMVDPLDITVIDDLQRLTGKMVQPLVATEEEIIDAFQRTRNISQSARELISRYKEEEAVAQEMDRLEYLGDAPGVKLANLILEQAIKQKASDVHFEPHERGCGCAIVLMDSCAVLQRFPGT